MYKNHISIAKNVQKRRVEWDQQEAKLEIITKKTFLTSHNQFFFSILKPCQIIIAKYMYL